MGRIINRLASGLRAASPRFDKAWRTGVKVKRGAKTTIIIVCFLLFFSATSSMLSSGSESLSKNTKDAYVSSGSSLTYEEWVNDSSLVYDAITKDGLVLTDSELLYLDVETFKRILEAIKRYENRKKESLLIVYDYKYIAFEAATSEDKELELLSGPVSVAAEDETEDKSEAENASEESEKLPYYIPIEEKRSGTVALERGDLEYFEQFDLDVVKLRWQPVVALASCVIQSNFKNWGSYADTSWNGADMENYYLSDEMIEDIIEVFYFKSEYYLDAIEKGQMFYHPEDFFSEGNIAYLYEYTDEGEGPERVIKEKLIPAQAPLSFGNSFMSYTYGYEKDTRAITVIEEIEDTESGTVKVSLSSDYKDIYVLKERTFTLIPELFVQKCKELAPRFSKENFLMQLKLLPGSMDLYWFYRDEIFKKAESYEITSVTTKDQGECAAIGIEYATPESLSQGGMLGWEDGAYTIPLYAETTDIYGVTPAAFLEDGEGEAKLLRVTTEAMRPLTVSDELTVAQIYRVLKNSSALREARQKSPLLRNNQIMQLTAQCLYDYQEESGNSVLGLMAIMTQEGGWKSTYAVNGWNFFHIRPSGSVPELVIPKGEELWHTGFGNYKQLYEKSDTPYGEGCVNALHAQIDSVGRNYWNNSKGQNTFYLMCFYGYDNVSLSTITHSYCPPWQDNAMPYSKDSYYVSGSGEKVYLWPNTHAGYTGWINKCAYIRRSFEEFLGIAKQEEEELEDE